MRIINAETTHRFSVVLSVRVAHMLYTMCKECVSEAWQLLTSGFLRYGGIGANCKCCLQEAYTSMIAAKHEKPYPQTMNWLRCRLCFSLPRSAVMCLRGSRSSAGHVAHSNIGEASIELSLSEAHLLQGMN